MTAFAWLFPDERLDNPWFPVDFITLQVISSG